MSEAALDALAGALGAEKAAVLLYDAGGVMRFKAWRGLSDAYRAAVEGHSPWRADDPAPAPVLVTDAQNDAALAPYKELFAREGIGALAFLPLVLGGRLLGKLMVYYEHARQFPAHEVELGTAIAAHLSSVIQRFDVIATLRETIRYNETFAGILAHDLRNPLGAISTAAQTLLRRSEGLGDRATKPLGRILSSSERMARMIDQLLDFTRARVGAGIEVHAREAHFAELCEQAIGEIDLAHPDWTVQLHARGDLYGEWDPDRILQVVSNLVANAGQHGVENAPIEVVLDGSAADEIVMTVKNTGTIDAQLLPHLFDPFRGSRHGSRVSRGLGLGLFITKEIVSAHGGTVVAESDAERGTLIRVRLPRRRSSAA